MKRGGSKRRWLKRLELSLRRWYTHHEWMIIGLLALFVGMLGYVGYQKYLVFSGLSPWDILYLDAQLFVLSNTITGFEPLELNLARFLAPAVLAYAGIKAALTIFHEQFSSFRVRFLKNHVVICGLGDKGMQLTKDFCDNGDQVIVIESDEKNDNIMECREKGAFVLIGDATDEYPLIKARVQHAKYLLLVCGDDGVNVETAMHCYRILQQKGKKQIPNKESSWRADTEMLQCFVHITDLQLRGLLTKHRIFTDTHDFFEMRLFNVYENSARKLFRDFPPDLYADTTQEGTHVHILVVGFGRMGQSVVLQAAKTCHYANREKLHVTVVDGTADKKKARFYNQYPQINKVCDINFENMDVNDPEFLEGKPLYTNTTSPITFIVIALEKSSLCLSCALSLQKNLGERKVPIMVRMKEDTGLAALLLDKGSDLMESYNIHPFGMINQNFTREIVVNEVLLQDKLAKAAHEGYVRNQPSKGQTIQTSRSILPWWKLKDDLKDSNRQFADHIHVKLRAVGCCPVESNGQKQKKFKFTKDEVELLAKMEHSRWTAECFLKGWTYGNRSKELRTSPHLVEWERLTDDIKESYRRAVRDIPDLLAIINLEIQRDSRTD